MPDSFLGHLTGSDPAAEADRLGAFIDASPTPFHAVAEVATALRAAGYVELSESERWPRQPGRYFVVRGGSLIAWHSGPTKDPGRPFRILGAHTDSPNLRVKPRADAARAGWRVLDVEPYGGPLLNSWLDRDLGLAGRVIVRTAEGPEPLLVTVPRALLRVAQLAIHLDREANSGLRLDPQQHLDPIWGVGTSPGDLYGFLGKELGVAAQDITGFELMAYPIEPSCRLGVERELLAAPRLDNLATTFAGLRALLAVSGAAADQAVDEASTGGAAAANDGSGRDDPDGEPMGGASAPDIGGTLDLSDPDVPTPVLVLFDHEEVGSVSERGAGSTLLPTILERIVLGAGGDREDLYRALAGSVVASGDMAHATHPNYPERHEPQHRITINGGPVLKINQNLRYATDAAGAAYFAQACATAGVPMQTYLHRADLPCGSTVGPVTSALTGVTTVDFGAPQLSMHSARELCGAYDPAMYTAALAAFLAPTTSGT